MSNNSSKLKLCITISLAVYLLFLCLSAETVMASTVLVPNEISIQKNFDAEIHSAPDGADYDVPQGASFGSTGATTRDSSITNTSGRCGTSAMWSFSGGVLTISGTGAVTDFGSTTPAGWLDFKGEITSVVVNSGITHIGDNAFYGYKHLTSVSLPSTVTSLGRASFAECDSLSTFNKPSGVTAIPYACFAECTSLGSFDFTNVKSLDDYAFQGVSFNSVNFPASLTNINTLAFYNARIAGYSVASGNSKYQSRGGVIFSDNYKTLIAYPTDAPATSYVIPSGVTKIAESGMLGTRNLKSITIPNTVTALEESAFQNSYALENIKLPDSIISVDDFTFYSCPKLKAVTFGNGLTVTSYQMFSKCTSLTNIVFGSKLKNLYAHTFSYCESLTSVNLPSNIKEVGVGCFGECHSLKSFVSKGVIGNIPYSAFWNCSSLATVTLNEGIKTINRCAFYSCSSLKSVTMPKSVMLVTSTAFPSATKVTCKNTELRPYGDNGYRRLQTVTVNGMRNYKMAYEVLALVNKERAKAGLGSLKMNASLLESAMKRAGETSVCFSHTRSDSSICLDINKAMTAENIAAGQKSASAVMSSWMSSSGHKANILATKSKTIGIGCFVQNGQYYWVQCFGQGSDVSSCKQPANKTLNQTMNLAIDKFEDAHTSPSVSFDFSGSSKEYSYKFSLLAGSSSIKVPSTTKLKVRIKNANINAYTDITNAGVSWYTGNKKVATVSGGTVKGVSKGTAKITAKLKYYSASKTITVKNAFQPGKGNITKIKKLGKTKITVYYKKLKYASRYQVQAARNKKFTSGKKIVTVKKTKAYVSKLKSKKTYYVRVRGYRLNGNKKIYGNWSKAKIVKMK